MDLPPLIAHHFNPDVHPSMPGTSNESDELADTRAYILQLEQAHDQRLADLNAARAEVVGLREALTDLRFTAKTLWDGEAARIIPYPTTHPIIEAADAALARTAADYANMTTISVDRLAQLEDVLDVWARVAVLFDSPKVGSGQSMVEAIHAQVADLKRDRDRLDWLDKTASPGHLNRWIEFAIPHWQAHRAAIDAAMDSATQPVAVEVHEDTIRLKGLRRLCGYVESGSDTTVKLFEDDATRTWFVKVGEKSHYGCCLTEAIDVAIAANPPDES